MPTPKNLHSYPDEYFAIIQAINEGAPSIRITESSHGRAINKRQHFYAFRKLMLEQQPLALGAHGAQIECAIAKGSSELVFQLALRQPGFDWNTQIDAQRLKAPPLPSLFPPAAAGTNEAQPGAHKALGLFAAAAGLSEAPTPAANFSNTMHDFETKLAELGFVPGPAAIRPPAAAQADIPPGANVTLPPDETPTT